MAVGSWKVNVSTDYPQKVATAVAKLTDELFGAEYKPIAYLGSQVVNGINHAVLAEQTILNGKDTKNAVVIVFNEKPNTMDVSLVSINTVVSGGNGLGAVEIDMTDDIPQDVKIAFEKAFAGYVGLNIEPFVYVGQQVTKGIDYILMAETVPVTLNPTKGIAVVTVHSMDNTLTVSSLIPTAKEAGELNYAFTW
jgi:hypothetical protein